MSQIGGALVATGADARVRHDAAELTGKYTRPARRAFTVHAHDVTPTVSRRAAAHPSGAHLSASKPARFDNNDKASDTVPRWAQALPRGAGVIGVPAPPPLLGPYRPPGVDIVQASRATAVGSDGRQVIPGCAKRLPARLHAASAQATAPPAPPLPQGTRRMNAVAARPTRASALPRRG